LFRHTGVHDEGGDNDVWRVIPWAMRDGVA
jgi:hypothetical protein